MKTILCHAKVYVEKGCYAQAVLVEDGLIAKVGTDEEIMSCKEDGMQVIDCGGRTKSIRKGFVTDSMPSAGIRICSSTTNGFPTATIWTRSVRNFRSY